MHTPNHRYISTKQGTYGTSTGEAVVQLLVWKDEEGAHLLSECTAVYRTVFKESFTR